MKRELFGTNIVETGHVLVTDGGEFGIGTAGFIFSSATISFLAEVFARLVF